MAPSQTATLFHLFLLLLLLVFFRIAIQHFNTKNCCLLLRLTIKVLLYGHVNGSVLN